MTYHVECAYTARMPRKAPDRQKRPVSLYLHPADVADLERAGKRRMSARVALALELLRTAPDDLLDRARVTLAKRDAA